MSSFQPKGAYSYEELIACANGDLFGPGNARLPAPPMLMFDRITEITKTGGAFGRGRIEAELDIHRKLWFFDCHFRTDPVMPGCLGLDAVWQLVGFFLAWSGFGGRGRALGCGEVKFTDQVLPDVRLVRYEVDMKRVGRGLGFAESRVLADGQSIYEMNGLRVGVFKEL